MDVLGTRFEQDGNVLRVPVPATCRVLGRGAVVWSKELWTPYAAWPSRRLPSSRSVPGSRRGDEGDGGLSSVVALAVCCSITRITRKTAPDVHYRSPHPPLLEVVGDNSDKTSAQPTKVSQYALAHAG